MPSGDSILPTHSCFDDALEFFEQTMKTEQLDKLADFAHEFRIVHGICRATDDGHRYVHAWVEQSAMVPGDKSVIVWQAGIVDGERLYFAVVRDAFYVAWGVERTTRYTLPLAMEANKQTGHYGPWRPEYRELRDRRTNVAVGGATSLTGADVVAVAPVRLLRG